MYSGLDSKVVKIPQKQQRLKDQAKLHLQLDEDDFSDERVNRLQMDRISLWKEENYKNLGLNLGRGVFCGDYARVDHKALWS